MKCGLPCSEDWQRTEWKQTFLQDSSWTKISSQSCVQISSGTAIPVEVIQPASEDWRPSERITLPLHEALRRIQNWSYHEVWWVSSSWSSAKCRSSLQLGSWLEEAHQTAKSGIASDCLFYDIHCPSQHSKPTSFEQLRHVETSTETVIVTSMKFPVPAQDKLSGPSSVETVRSLCDIREHRLGSL